MEIAMEQRKQTLEKLEIARDDLTIQLRNLEQNLQEKDLKVEVMLLCYKMRLIFIDISNSMLQNLNNLHFLF